MSLTNLKYLTVQGEIQNIYEVKEFKNSHGVHCSYKTFDLKEVKRYPKLNIFHCYNEKMDLLRGLQPGSIVRVHFNIESNRYNDRCYTTLKVCGIEKVD